MKKEEQKLKELDSKELKCDSQCAYESVDPHLPNRPQKLSYEQLVDTINQFQNENMNLRRALQEQSMENVFMRLNYLFEVVKINSVFSSEFVQECADEITTLLAIKKEKVENLK